MEQLNLPLSKSEEDKKKKDTKKILDDVIYIEGDITDRDGTTEDIPVFQTEEGKWKIGDKEVTAREVLLTAGRELPADVRMKLKEKIEEEKEAARKKPN